MNRPDNVIHRHFGPRSMLLWGLLDSAISAAVTMSRQEAISKHLYVTGGELRQFASRLQDLADEVELNRA